MLKVDYEIIPLETKYAFNIARATAPPQRRNVWVRIADGELEGWGEAAPNAFYAEDADTVVEALKTYAPIVEKHDGEPLATLESLEHLLLNALPSRHPKYPPHPSARSAISAAMLDLAGKRDGKPVWQLLNLDNKAPVSSFTIAIDELELMRAKVREARTYQVLKIKVGTRDDRAILQMLRDEVPDARIRVDANTAWTAKSTIAMLPMLEEFGIELIEQPVPADDYDGLAQITKASRIPVIADESCRIASDVEKLAGCVDGVNIKLAKCGSILEGVRIAEAARRHGMQVMLGCMVESTLAIAGAIQFTSLTDYVDLDGAALLVKDPFNGPHIDETGAVHFNQTPGLGVTRSGRS